MWLGPVVLSIAGLLGAIFAGAMNYNFVSPMASAIAGMPVEAHAKVVFHIGVPLGLSIVTIGLGIAIFLKLKTARAMMAAIPMIAPVTVAVRVTTEATATAGATATATRRSASALPARPTSTDHRKPHQM